MAVFATYAAYLVISVVLTIAVGWALARSGRVFLTSASGDERMAAAVSRLLVLGFCLLNLGFVALTASVPGQISSGRQAFGMLFPKVGAELLVLGALLAASVAVFTRFRRRQRPGPAAAQPPPPQRQPGLPGSPAAPGPGAAPFWRHGPGRPAPGPRQAVH